MSKKQEKGLKSLASAILWFALCNMLTMLIGDIYSSFIPTSYISPEQQFISIIILVSGLSISLIYPIKFMQEVLKEVPKNGN